MKILEQTREGAVVKVRVEIPAEEIENDIQAAFAEARKTIQIDGFRPGKVPAGVIQKRYGAQIKAEALEQKIQEVYPKVLHETGLRPVVPGDIEAQEYDSQDALRFTAIIEVIPEFEADKWRGIKVLMEKGIVSDENVDLELDRYRQDKAIISVRGEDEASENGDRVTIDLQRIDEEGNPVEGKTAKDFVIDLGHGRIGKDADEQLVGIKVGETRNILVKSESKEEDEDKELRWACSASKIEKVELPDMDEDFLAEIDDSFKTVDDLKADIRKRLENYAEYQANQRFANRLIDEVVKVHEIDLPPTLLQETIARMVDSRQKEANNMVPAEQIESYVKPLAEQQLKWYFLRDKIIHDLEIDVTDEMIDEELAKKAEMGYGDLESLKVQFAGGENREALRGEIQESKLMEELRNGVELDEQEVPFIQLMM